MSVYCTCTCTVYRVDLATGSHDEQSHTHSRTSSLAEHQNTRTNIAEWFKCSGFFFSIRAWYKIKHIKVPSCSCSYMFFSLFAGYFGLVWHLTSSISQTAWSFIRLHFFVRLSFSLPVIPCWVFLDLDFLCRWCWSETLAWGKHVYWSVLKTELSWLAASSPLWASTLGWV